MATKVSIPFKREGVFKGCGGRTLSRTGRVSIPFKREGVFKVDCPKKKKPSGVQEVSIPFKREGVFKD